MPHITGLGHVGLYCEDLGTMRMMPGMTVIAPSDPGSLSEDFTVTIAGSAEPLTFKATGKIGTLVRTSPLGTPPDLQRVYVRLHLIVGKPTTRPPADVTVAYRLRDVREVEL